MRIRVRIPGALAIQEFTGFGEKGQYR